MPKYHAILSPPRRIHHLGRVKARKAVPAGPLLPQGLVVLLEGGDAPLQLRVRVWRDLELNGLEGDAQVLELVVVLLELLFQVRYPALQEDDALGCALGTLDEKSVDVLVIYLVSKSFKE